MSDGRAGAEPELLAFWRRMVRVQQPYTVVVVELAAVYRIHENQRNYRVQQRLLQEFADVRKGNHFTLANGDVVVAVPGADETQAAAIIDEIIDWILRDPDQGEEGIRRRVRVFLLPRQFLEVREWIARYLPGGELGGATLSGGPDGDEPVLETLAGPLTPYLLRRVEHRIARCDIRPFIHRQMVFARSAGRSPGWTPVIEERLIGVADLAAKLFPDLEVSESGPFFGQFCAILDERLIHHLMASRARFEAPVSINLSLEMLFDRLFASFASHVPQEERPRLFVEIHCGEIFLDVAKAHAAIERLRGYGFGVIVDGMTLELLPYVRVNRFDCDYLKVHLPRADIAKLMNEDCVKALRSLSREKVVFTRCDTRGALDVGHELDIRLYQGWLVDSQVHGAVRKG